MIAAIQSLFTGLTLDTLRKKDRQDFEMELLRAKGEKRGLAHHSSSNNTITVNHSRNDKEFNQRSHSIETLIHEHRHQLAALNGAYDYPISLEQAYKRDKHDEIAANIDVFPAPLIP